jgi:hypothetical protein
MNDNIFAKARKVGIEEILQRLGAKRAGGRGTRLLYHCPFREDRNPSMYVNTDKGTWRDMANPDEYKGDVIKLVELTHKPPFIIEDKSSLYAPHNDANDWYVASR